MEARKIDANDLAIIKVVASQPGIKIIQVAKSVELSRCRAHARAQRLCQIGILSQSVDPRTTRKLKPTYIYSLSPDTSVSEIEEAVKTLGGTRAIAKPLEPTSSGESRLTTWADVWERLAERLNDMSDRIDQLEGQTQSRFSDLDWRAQLLHKLPPFDSNWSDAVQEKWFDSFFRLLELYASS